MQRMLKTTGPMPEVLQVEHVTPSAPEEPDAMAAPTPEPAEALPQPALVPQPAAVQEEGRAKVGISLTVCVMDYAGIIMADPYLRTSFEEATQQAIAAEAGSNITPDNVTLVLSLAGAGDGIVVKATISPCADADATAVREALRCGDSLGPGLAAHLEREPELRAVLTGRVGVRDISEPVKFIQKARPKADVHYANWQHGGA